MLEGGFPGNLDRIDFRFTLWCGEETPWLPHFQSPLALQVGQITSEDSGRITTARNLGSGGQS